jgi:hypothetical protein
MKNTNEEREGWNSDQLGEESVYEGKTENQRRMQRGDESKGDPNERDTAGDHLPVQKNRDAAN